MNWFDNLISEGLYADQGKTDNKQIVKATVCKTCTLFQLESWNPDTFGKTNAYPI